MKVIKQNGFLEENLSRFDPKISESVAPLTWRLLEIASKESGEILSQRPEILLEAFLKLLNYNEGLEIKFSCLSRK